MSIPIPNRPDPSGTPGGQPGPDPQGGPGWQGPQAYPGQPWPGYGAPGAPYAPGHMPYAPAAVIRAAKDGFDGPFGRVCSHRVWATVNLVLGAVGGWIFLFTFPGLLFAIGALVTGGQVEDAVMRGDLYGAASRTRRAQTLNVVSSVLSALGVGGMIAYVVLIISQAS